LDATSFTKHFFPQAYSNCRKTSLNSKKKEIVITVVAFLEKFFADSQKAIVLLRGLGTLKQLISVGLISVWF
jgi:hypothetical protein